MKKLFTLFFVTFIVTIASAQELDGSVKILGTNTDVVIDYNSAVSTNDKSQQQLKLESMKSSVNSYIHSYETDADMFRKKQAELKELIEKNKKGKDMQQTYSQLCIFYSMMMQDYENIKKSLNMYYSMVNTATNK